MMMYEDLIERYMRIYATLLKGEVASGSATPDALREIVVDVLGAVDDDLNDLHYLAIAEEEPALELLSLLPGKSLHALQERFGEDIPKEEVIKANFKRHLIDFMRQASVQIIRSAAENMQGLYAAVFTVGDRRVRLVDIVHPKRLPDHRPYLLPA